MIYNIHLLRVVAALAVVYAHISSKAGLNLPLVFGSFGVDVFFVISGFIIAYIGSKNPHAFFLRRVIRIVPFYWSASLLVFGIAVIFPRLLRQTKSDLPHLLYSLFFIPHETAYSGMYPTLLLGWTLNYEMYFYALFAISLVLSRQIAPIICSLLLTLIFIAIRWSGTANPSLLFYADPIVFEFVFGIAVYAIVNRIARRADDLQRAGWLKLLLFVAMLVASAVLVVQGIFDGFGWPRYLVGGVPAFVLVLSAILVEKVFRVAARNRSVFVLGESSYILYLIHPYIVYGVIRLFIGSVASWNPLAVGLLVVALLALPSIVSVAIHLWFEKPVMDALRRALVQAEPRDDSRLAAPVNWPAAIDAGPPEPTR